MKRVLAVFLSLTMLTGCSRQERGLDRVMSLRQKLHSGNGCSYDAYITADYGGQLYTFTLQCQGDPHGNISFCVLDPGSIAGITGTIDAEKGALTFDEHVLAFSLLADGQLTPVSAPWLFLKALLGGYIRGCSQQDSYLYAAIDDSYEEESMLCEVWLDENDAPARCDFLWMGRRILSMEVKNFQHL